jgi:hypothetical protein
MLRAALKKLCNHPKLIYDAMHARAGGAGDGGGSGGGRSGGSGGGGPDGFEVRARRLVWWACLMGAWQVRGGGARQRQYMRATSSAELPRVCGHCESMACSCFRPPCGQAKTAE